MEIKLDISIPFGLRDMVWHWDLKKQKPVQTRVSSFTVVYSEDAELSESKDTTVVYRTDDGYFTHMTLEQPSKYDLYSDKFILENWETLIKK